jgi:hypothetical protein
LAKLANLQVSLTSPLKVLNTKAMSNAATDDVNMSCAGRYGTCDKPTRPSSHKSRKMTVHLSRIITHEADQESNPKAPEDDERRDCGRADHLFNLNGGARRDCL